ncbi:D-alanyl-D-alanine carboxypeptidase/D-alanyl-D-alanine-endopeptidase [Akkermansiaceae bacterium]|nr:D-alanyl-D-alanine carboxypeptidase/D-alanyl-D-alanine-endopeptidase [Akkermansiaceae bacterium]
MIRGILTLFLGLAPALKGDVALEAFLKSPSLRTASVGLCIVPLEGDEGMMEHHADLALIPASTLKAVTTATALQILGTEHRFVTRLLRDGDDVVVKGGGDPTLSMSSPEAEFPGWLAALKEAGMTEIKGDLVMDSSHFGSRVVPNSWPWGDVGNYYGSGAWGLSYHLNSYGVTFKPRKVGAPAKLVGTYPKPPGVRFENFMRTGSPGSGDQGYAYGGPDAEVVSFRGTVPGGRSAFTIKGALPNPPLSCGEGFKRYLLKEGFPVAGEVKISIGKGEEIHRQEGPSLEKLVTATNHRSVNLYAEALMQDLGGLSVMKKHWAAQGVDLTGMVLHDGSGLSPRNSITPRQLAEILKRAQEHETGALFEKSLPMAGRSGTLVSFGNGSAIAGRVRAKSGGMSRVKTYAGYLTKKSGKRYAFTLMTNNYVSSPKAAMVKFLSAQISK